MRASVVLPLLFLGAVGHTATVMAQSRGTFTATGSMITARSQHTATLLLDGRVLIAGGMFSGPGGGSALASAELYDPSTGIFTATGSMTTARRSHTATLLSDGRVLIAGGTLSDATGVELYDPSTGSFAATGDMINARGGHTAILLANGTVLMVGGFGTGYGNFAGAELYDPATGTFAATGEYVVRADCDFCAPAVLLADGKVLFAQQGRAQLYNPVTSAFNVTGATSDCLSAAALLMNGKVLFAGGECDEVGRSSLAELYDPATGTFASTRDMAWRRVGHTLTLLPDGTVLAAGGETEGCAGNRCMLAGSVASAELYDPSTGAFTATDDMTGAREGHTATLLKDGKVLMTGGVSYGGIGLFFGSLARADLYVPPGMAPAPELLSLPGDRQGQGAILHADTHQVVSPVNPAIAGEALEIYCAGLIDGGVIPPQVAIGGRMAEILFFGKAPGFAGLNQVNLRVPGGAAPGPAVPVRLTYIGRPSNEVTIGLQK